VKLQIKQAVVYMRGLEKYAEK
jgi:hypothetical protein